MLRSNTVAQRSCSAILCAFLAISCHDRTGGRRSLELVDRDEPGDRGTDGQDNPVPPMGTSSLAAGSDFVVGTTSFAEQPATIDIDVPADAAVKQVLLYWDSPADTADDVLLVNGTAVQGARIRAGKNTSRPVYRTDLLELGLVQPGTNTLTLSGLDLGDGEQAGASVVVVYDDDSGVAVMQLRDGSSEGQPAEGVGEDGSITHTFAINSSDTANPVELALLVSDGAAGGTYDVVVRAGDEVVSSGEVQPGDAYWASELQSLEVPPGVDSVQVTVSPRDGAAADLWVQSALRQACVGSISGRIGDSSAGDTGLSGVEVALERDGQVLAMTTTAEDGAYSFAGLCQGEHVVRVDPETLPENFRRTDCTDDATSEEPRCDFTSTVVLERNDSQVEAADFDFAGPCTGRVGDLVWNDLNGDGIAALDEPGLFCVTVLLSQEGSDLILEETVTDANGNFEFNQRCAGSYVVTVKEETLPRDFSASPCSAGEDDTRDNDCSPVTVVLESDSSRALTYDLGFLSACSGEIRGDVTRAASAEGDAGGEPIEGVVFRILDNDRNLVAKTVSGLDGYSFQGLCAGDYLVEIDPESVPSNVSVGGCVVAGETLDDCSSVPVRIDEDGDVQVIDFPLDSSCSNSISGLVWNERTDDEILDGAGVNERGIEGVRLVLKDASGTEVLSSSTRARGEYTLAGLCAGSYTLEVDPSTIPPGWGAAPCFEIPSGRRRASQSTCLPTAVVLASDDGEMVQINTSFASASPGRYVARVFNDANRDGIWGEDENGIEGARVTLYDETGAKITSVTSRPSGSSNFDGLAEGIYILEVDESTVPEGYTQALCVTEAEAGIDSRCNRASFQIPPTDDRQFVLFGYSEPLIQEGDAPIEGEDEETQEPPAGDFEGGEEPPVSGEPQPTNG